MILKDGDKYIQIKSNIKFILKQETPVTWSLNLHEELKDYPIYPENHMKDLLEKNFRRVEDE